MKSTYTQSVALPCKVQNFAKTDISMFNQFDLDIICSARWPITIMQLILCIDPSHGVAEASTTNPIVLLHL